MRRVPKNNKRRRIVPPPPQPPTSAVTAAVSHEEMPKNASTSVSVSEPPYGNESAYKMLLLNKRRLFPYSTETQIIPSSSTTSPTTPLNFCVPLWNRAENIKQLLDNLQTQVNDSNEKNFKLWIADFNSTDVVLDELIKQYKMPIEIVKIDGPFIIAKGLQIAAEKLPLGEIVYFIDADAVFPKCIFQRVRNCVTLGKQFYCPMIAFEQENGKIIFPKGGRDHGGKGHIGVFVNDFIKCRGWRDNEHLTETPIPGPGPMERQKWGGHDGHLYNKLRWDHLNCCRPHEMDQWSRHHNRATNPWYKLGGRTNNLANKN